MNPIPRTVPTEWCGDKSRHGGGVAEGAFFRGAIQTRPPSSASGASRQSFYWRSVEADGQRRPAAQCGGDIAMGEPATPSLEALPPVSREIRYDRTG